MQISSQEHASLSPLETLASAVSSGSAYCAQLAAGSEPISSSWLLLALSRTDECLACQLVMSVGRDSASAKYAPCSGQVGLDKSILVSGCQMGLGYTDSQIGWDLTDWQEGYGMDICHDQNENKMA